MGHRDPSTDAELATLTREQALDIDVTTSVNANHHSPGFEGRRLARLHELMPEVNVLCSELRRLYDEEMARCQEVASPELIDVINRIGGLQPYPLVLAWSTLMTSCELTYAKFIHRYLSHKVLACFQAKKTT